MFTTRSNNVIHRKRNKALGIPELIAIALGGMVGGGIFTILGISVAMIGVFTPLAIILGHWGTDLVILGALLATSSAISGTLFGASRQMSVIAKDGYLPGILARRVNHIPVYAIISMAGFAFLLVLAGSTAC